MYEYNLGLRFASVAARREDAVALWWGDEQSLTYGALNRMANRCAAVLAAQGVGAGDVVALAGVKTPATFSCMLACLKLGAVYSIMDPAAPTERLSRILGVLEPCLVVADTASGAQLEPAAVAHGVPLAMTDSEAWQEAISSATEGDPAGVRAVTGDAAAYVMFTSGSTGFPKGAVMTHANVLNLVDWSAATFGIGDEDVLTNVNPLYFDNSVFDFYSALFNGARLVPFHREEVVDPRALVAKVDAARCTLWFSVPSLLIFLQAVRAADGKHLRSITRFAFGGEGYPKAKLKALFDVYTDSAAFFNVYGPTECTCICSAYELSPEDLADGQGLPALGRIADNFGFLILDEALEPVAPGEVGELCLLGPNVGRGYYNDPDRTRVAFVPNPHNRGFTEVMYRTGDLVRVEPNDGKLRILGRRDNQIKHMGYRIELEEIDAALHGLVYVEEGASFQAELRGMSRIVAAVVCSREVSEEDVRSDLRMLLPEYMVPGMVLALERLPRNANGKVDRMALREGFLTTVKELN